MTSIYGLGDLPELWPLPYHIPYYLVISVLVCRPRTVEEYLAEFRLLTPLAGMTADTTSDNIHLINYFQQGLNPAIAKKIALSDNMPTTIAEWSDRAVQYDANYRLTMAKLGNAAYRNQMVTIGEQALCTKGILMQWKLMR